MQKHTMSVSDVYKELYDNKYIKVGLTNQNTKCVFRNTPEYNVNTYFMVIKELLGHADLLGIRTITYLLTNHIFIFSDFIYDV